MTLDAEQRALVRQAAAWAPGGEGTTKISIEVAALFPKFGRFGSTEGVVHTEGMFYTPGAYVPVQAAPLASHADAWHTMQNLTVTAHLDELSGQRWWSVGQSRRDDSPFNTTVDDGVRLVASADRLAGSAAARSITSGGLLAFYALVVYGFGRLVRDVFGGTRYRIAIDEMPDTRDVVDLLEGVYIARRECDFPQETLLHETVVRLYRSAESLTRLTGYHLVRNEWEE